MSDLTVMVALVFLHIPGIALLWWLLRNLRDNDPAAGGDGGSRVREPQSPDGYRWRVRRRRPSPHADGVGPRRPLPRRARAAP